MGTSPDRALGFRLIVTYKFVRGTIALAAAIALFIAAARGGGQWMHVVAHDLRVHFVGAWSTRLAALVDHAASRRSLNFAAIALTCDGLFTLFEGWALRRRFGWAPWLVVAATSSLIPFEIFKLLQRISVPRILLLLVNAAVVIYLVRAKLSDRGASADSHG